MSLTSSAGLAPSDGWSGRRSRWLNRFHARLSALVPPRVSFISQPEPRSIGSYVRGQQLVAGDFLFAGHHVQSGEGSIWDVPMPSLAFQQELHGFAWLDDLAALGTPAARRRAQKWLNDWIRRFGRGRGPAWTPELTGRRMVRWINHAIFLLNSQEKPASDAYFAALSHQTVFLSRRWKSASPGLPRFEALTGLLYAGLSLEGMERHVAPATRALAVECRVQIDESGAIPTRNPEELLEIFTMLTWCAAGLSESGRAAAQEHLQAIERIAPTLRALSHSDGGLARFHGGGRGLPGRLDLALAASGVRATANPSLAMGYARLAAGRTTLIADAAPPPRAEASYNAHASTLAIELTSGRRPVIVNCGAGTSFGPRWRQAGRATPLHSTLSIDGFSSSRLGAKRLIRGIERELLLDTPDDVRSRPREAERRTAITLGHNGYVRTHGLSHVRRLELSADGRDLSGHDTLGALTERDKRRLMQHLSRSGTAAVGFTIRFHLHPDAEAELNMGGNAVAISLRSGEVWVFRRRGGTAQLSLQPSVYLEKGRLRPRASKQIVLRSAVTEYATQVSWTLAKAQDTPSHIRDLERDELLHH
jgi:uncharacterized heparinase superfamily protein